MKGIKLIFYKLYIFFLALWMGGSAYSTLSIADTWYEDPVTYIDHVVAYPVPGGVDPMPTIAIILTIIAVLCILILFTYHGPGKKTALVSCGGTFLIMIFNTLYFNPTYNKLFDDGGVFNNQVIQMSRMWILLNYGRIFLMIVVFFLSIIGLSKFKERRVK